MRQPFQGQPWHSERWRVNSQDSNRKKQSKETQQQNWGENGWKESGPQTSEPSCAGPADHKGTGRWSHGGRDPTAVGGAQDGSPCPPDTPALHRAFEKSLAA